MNEIEINDNVDYDDYTFLINLFGTWNLGYDQNTGPYAFQINKITNIFSNASFRQNQSNDALYDVNITLAPSNTYYHWSYEVNNRLSVKILQGNSNIAFATLKPNSGEIIGDRLLEVVAHKLFGHGQARAAISNDREFYNHDAQLWDHLSTSLANDHFAHEIFNQYVAFRFT